MKKSIDWKSLVYFQDFVPFSLAPHADGIERVHCLLCPCVVSPISVTRFNSPDVNFPTSTPARLSDTEMLIHIDCKKAE